MTEHDETLEPNGETNAPIDWELDLYGDLSLQQIDNLSFEQIKEIATRAQQTAEEANEIAAQKEAAAKEAERAAQIARMASADADQAKQSAAEITSKAELLLNKLREAEAKEQAQQAAILAQEKQAALSKIEQELAELEEKLAVARQEAADAQEQAAVAKVTPSNFWQESEAAPDDERKEVIETERAYAVAVSTSALAEDAQKKADELQEEYHANKKEQAALATEIEKWLAKEENAQTAMTRAQRNQEVLAKKIADKEFSFKEEDVFTERQDNFAAVSKEEVPIFKEKKSHPFLSFCLFIILVVGAALAIKTFVLQIANISGESMYPTLHDDDKVLVSMVSYYLGDPERGDIVIISSAERFSDKYIKRIIALPGEHIVIKNNQVFVDDTLLEEDYLTNTYTNGNIDTIVPAESYFVMGDNRTKSSDSRSGSISFIKREEIVGKAFLVIYPKDNWKKLD